jgi:hypothetical protein
MTPSIPAEGKESFLVVSAAFDLTHIEFHQDPSQLYAHFLDEDVPPRNRTISPDLKRCVGKAVCEPADPDSKSNNLGIPIQFESLAQGIDSRSSAQTRPHSRHTKIDQQDTFTSVMILLNYVQGRRTIPSITSSTQLSLLQTAEQTSVSNMSELKPLLYSCVV